MGECVVDLAGDLGFQFPKRTSTVPGFFQEQCSSCRLIEMNEQMSGDPEKPLMDAVTLLRATIQKPDQEGRQALKRLGRYGGAHWDFLEAGNSSGSGCGYTRDLIVSPVVSRVFCTPIPVSWPGDWVARQRGGPVSVIAFITRFPSDWI